MNTEFGSHNDGSHTDGKAKLGLFDRIHLFRKDRKRTVAIGAAVVVAASLITVAGLNAAAASSERDASTKKSSLLDLAAPIPLGAAPATGASAVNVPKFPTIANGQQVTNQSWSDDLVGWGKSETNWYHCGDHYKITSPQGVVSAYPYGTDAWGIGPGQGWHNTSTSSGETASSSNADREHGAIQILFSNIFTTRSTNSISFDCTATYPGFNTEAINVEDPQNVTTTTATLNAQVQEVATWKHNPSELIPSPWHVEYGTAPGDYSHSSIVQMTGVGSNPVLSTTLTGLQPDTTYHYRFVFDEDKNYDGHALLPNYSSPNNTFTTASAPAPAPSSAFGIASADNASQFITVPGGTSSPATPLGVLAGNGGSAQQWRLVPDGDGDGYFKIVTNNGNPGLCVDIDGGARADATVTQNICDISARNQDNQLWKPVLYGDGSYLLQAKGHDLLLAESNLGAQRSLTTITSAAPIVAATARWNFIKLGEAGPAFTLTANASSVAPGQDGAAPLRATLPADATGSVTFYDTVDGNISTLGTEPVDHGTATLQKLTSPIQEGTHDIYAVYSGDTKYVSKVSNHVSVQAAKQIPAMAMTLAGRSSLIVTLHDGSVATPIMVKLPADATGTVTFGYINEAIPTSPPTLLGTVTVFNGTANSAGLGIMPKGDYGVTATYSGDNRYTSNDAAQAVWFLN